MTTTAQLVQRGINLLDAAPGYADWRSRIDVETLDLNSFKTCVIGQLFGDFCDGMDVLGFSGEDDNEAASYGFDAFIGGNTPEQFAALTTEWKRVLTPVA